MCSGSLSVNFTSTFSTVIGVYEVPTPPSLTSLTLMPTQYTSDCYDCVVTSVTGGHTYAIQVDGSYSTSGTFNITVTLIVPPPNDLFANRLPLQDGVVVTGTTVASTVEPGEPFSGYSIGHSVW